MADIGTDHAYLPLHLLEEGRISYAVACDIHKGPLVKAKEHIIRENRGDCVEIRLGAGIEPLTTGEVDGVTIAGMGGLMIIDILKDSPEKAHALPGGTLVEMILTQFIINLRYSLMSLSLSQKLEEAVGIKERLVIAFANTDEIFAVAMGHVKELTFGYMIGLQLLPIVGWTGGTLFGAVASGILPKSISSALSLALYGMFVAIVMPVARKSRPVAIVALVAAAISCVLYYVPIFKFISTGIAIIISTVAASVIGAIFFPVGTAEKKEVQ